MSTPAAPAAGAGPPPGTIACPRCGAAIGPDQDWCVHCGVAARTRIAPVPHWKRPIATIATVAAIALAAVAVALVSLSNSDAPPVSNTITAVTGPPSGVVTTPAPGALPGSTIGTPTTVAPAIPGAPTTPTTTPTAPTTIPPRTTPPATTPPASGGASAP